jgi:hypothetical protein
MKLQRWQWFALGLFALAVAARLLPGLRTIDDAYITFRYARNLLAGNGFVFNMGERVLGTTTPLFTLLLAAIGLFTGGAHAPFPEIALIVSALDDGFSAVLILKLGQRLGAKWAGAGAALAWAVAPFSVTFAIGGLETSFYVFLLLATCWAYLEKRWELAALLAALSLLTRPDALLLILPLALDRLWLSPRRGEQRVQRNEVLLFMLPLLAWGLFAWLYFGSPIPQSLLAKSAAYRLPPLSALVRLLQHYATPFLEHLTFGLSWIKIGLLLYPFLGLVGARAAFKREPASWPLAVFPWIYFAAFVSANPLIFRWYLTTPLPFYFLFILIGLQTVLFDLLKYFKLNLTRIVNIVSLSVFILPMFSLRGWTLHPAQPPDRPAPVMAWIELELLYEKAAQYLAPQLAVNPHATIAAGDVGALGYFTGVPILDLVGLNSPETTAYYPLEEKYYGDFVYAISPDLIINERPDYVVILEIYGRYGLLKDDRFLTSYQLLATIPTEIYGSDGLLIYALDQ